VRRLVPLVGATIVLGSLTLVALQQLPGDEPGGDATARHRALPTPPADSEALRLVRRAASAPATVAYAGTQYLAAWESGRSTSHVLRVTHSPATGTTWRATGAGGSASRQVHQSPHSVSPSVAGVGEVALLTRHYALTAAGSAEVAGRGAEVVEARRPLGTAGAGSVAARFWLDRETGLLLRREVYDRTGRVIRASAYVDLTVRPATDTPRADGRDDGAWRDALDAAAVRRLRDHGWNCPASLPGPLPLVDARRGGRSGDIVHFSYADGIASVSVFQQRGRLDAAALDGFRPSSRHGHDVWVRPGVPRRVVWSDGGTVFTVVADASPRTVDRAVAALHAAAPRGGGDTVHRLGRGLNRVASWFNPFE
jgi:sigma-E factor negative regulatory protein RseB